MAGGHSDTQNGRGESVRLKQLSVFRYLRQPRSATTLKKWRGEESPSVLRRRGCQHFLIFLLGAFDMTGDYAASYLPWILIPIVCWLMPAVVMGLLFIYIESES